MSVSNYTLVGIMYFRKGSLGWSEKVFPKSSTYDDAKTKMAALIAERLKLLPTDAFLVYARVSVLGSPRDAEAIELAYPLAGTDSTLSGPPSNVPWKTEAAVAVRFQARTNDSPPRAVWKNSFLRCLPTDQANDDALSNTITIPAIGSSDNVGTTWKDKLGNYLAHVRDTTSFVQPLPPLPGPPVVPQANVLDHTAAIVRGLTTRDTGRPFGLRRGRAIPR